MTLRYVGQHFILHDAMLRCLTFDSLTQKRTIARQTPAKTGAAAIGRDSDPSAHARRVSVAPPVVTVSKTSLSLGNVYFKLN